MHGPAHARVGDPELHIVIEDQGGSVGVTVMNLTVLPKVTVTPDPTGHIRAGSTVGLHYSPASDDLGQMTVSLRSTGTDDWYVNNLTFSTLFQGADGSITIPAGMPAGSVDFLFAGERLPQIVGCDTVSKCVVDYPWGSGRVPMELVIARELEILGSHGLSARDYPAMLEAIIEGRLRPDRLVGRTIGLDDAPAALMAMGGPPATPGMTVIRPNDR